MEVEEEPAKEVAKLTEEEQKKWFKKSTIMDLTPTTLNANFSKYSIPEKSEGFDEVKFEWQPAAKVNEYLAGWRQEKKVTARVEDLIIGDWYEARMKEWSKWLASLKQKQNDYKAAVAKRVADKQTKEKLKQMKANAKKARAEKKAAAHKAAVLKAEKEAEARKAQRGKRRRQRNSKRRQKRRPKRS